MAAVDGILNRPAGSRALYVLAHGAGAGMRHAFMETISDLLAAEKIASFRYQFPYMSAGKKRPDSPRMLMETVRDAVATARKKAPRLPLVAGGKSMGGRMTSRAAAEGGLDGVRGLVFLGFPLHAPGRPGLQRGEHLGETSLPMLFVQGTRDSLADLDLIKETCDGLGRRASLHVVDGGDHSFKVLKRSGRIQSQVMQEIAETVSAWVGRVV